jgi:hypothetical protein
VVTARAVGGLVRRAGAPGTPPGRWAQRPGAGRGMIESDFGFHGRSAANKLSKFRENWPGGGAGWTNRTERARAGLSGCVAPPV